MKRKQGFSTKGDNAMTRIILSSWVFYFLLAWFSAVVVAAVAKSILACRKQTSAR